MKKQQDKAVDGNAEDRTNIVQEEPWKSVTGAKEREDTLHQWNGKTVFRFLKRNLPDSMQTYGDIQKTPQENMKKAEAQQNTITYNLQKVGLKLKYDRMIH